LNHQSENLPLEELDKKNLGTYFGKEIILSKNKQKDPGKKRLAKKIKKNYKGLFISFEKRIFP
jgi:hypothetical protein